jgi:hypothetical protein
MDLFYLVTTCWDLPRLLEFMETLIVTLKMMPSDEWPPEACIQPGYLLPHFTLGGQSLRRGYTRHLPALADLVNDITMVVKQEKVPTERLEHLKNAARAWFVVLYFYDIRIQLLVQVPHSAHRIWRTVPPDEARMRAFRKKAEGTVGNYILEMNHLAEYDPSNVKTAHEQTRFFLAFIRQWWKPGIHPTFPSSQEAVTTEKEEEEASTPSSLNREGTPPATKKQKV